MPKPQTKVINIIAPDKGIYQNLPKHLIRDESWSEGNNIRFGQGYIEKIVGWKKFIANQLDGELMAIDNYYKFNGDSYLIFITTKRVYTYDDTNGLTDITGGTLLNGTPDHPVITENAQNCFVFTNGIDRVKYWDGVAATIADFPGLNNCVGPGGAGVNVTKCKALLYFKNFLLLLGTTETIGGSSADYPQRVRWSQIGDIFNWKNDTANTQAGYGDLSDGVDWGQALRPLNDFVVAYKERSIHVLRYIGGDLVWDKNPAIIGTGLISPKALVDLGDEHVFIGPDNIYSFDLREVKIAGDAISKEFFDNRLNPGKIQSIITAYIEEIPEAWFVFTSTTSPDGFPDKAIVYNVDTKAWSWRDAPMTAFGYYNAKDENTWESDTEATWDRMDIEWDSSRALANAPINLCGDSQGYIYVLGDNSKDGADMSAYVRTKLFDFGDPFHLKRVKRIQFQISREGPYHMQVRVGTAANVDETITWSHPHNMSLDITTPPWIDIDYTGRYFIFEFATLKKTSRLR